MTDWVIDSLGWLSSVRHCVSPNYSPRPVDGDPTLVVVHAISLPPRQFGGPAVEDLFMGTLSVDAHPYFDGLSQLSVSAHFFISRKGATTQFVSTDQSAWHAGVSSWQGREKCNHYSIGIELEGCDELPFEPYQYQALNKLLVSLKHRYALLGAAAGHSEIAPGRKSDPGPLFDWSHLPTDWRNWKNDTSRACVE